MASFVKYESAIQFIMNKECDFFGTNDTVRAVIHSDAPIVATDAALSDLTETSGTGYTAGGEDTQNDGTRSGGTFTATAVDIVWTAGAGGFAQARYVSTYDDTSTNNDLINYWDYGSNFTVASGETFTLDFGASWFTAS